MTVSDFKGEQSVGFLRFLLAACVVGAHYEHPSYLPFIPGDLAVQFFFLLSGFYMALILSENPNYRTRKIFYSARFARIYSSYLIFFILGLVVALPKIVELDWKSLSIASLLVIVFSNLFIFGTDAVMFLENSTSFMGIGLTSNFRESDLELHTFLILPQAWSLPLELYFYLLAPFIINRKRALIVLLAFSIGSRFASIVLYGNIDPWTYRFFPSELVLFISGKFTYDFYVYLKQKILFRKIESINLGTRILLIPIFGYFIFLCYQREYGLLPSSISNSSFATTVRPLTLFGLAICLTPVIFWLSRDVKIDKALGELSYPIYLSHLSVITLCERLDFSPTFFQVLFGSTILAIGLTPICKKLEKRLNSLFARLFTKFDLDRRFRKA